MANNTFPRGRQIRPLEALEKDFENFGETGRKKLLRTANDFPKGWDKNSMKAFWKSVGGSMTACIDKISGVEGITNPASFCAWAHYHAEGKWPRESNNKFREIITKLRRIKAKLSKI